MKNAIDEKIKILKKSNSKILKEPIAAIKKLNFQKFNIIKSLYISFDIESNGLISAAPFICQSILTFFGGWYTDYIRSKGTLYLIIIISKVKTYLLSIKLCCQIS